jgi:hypothetical protein
MTVDQEIAALSRMTTKQLKRRFADLTGDATSANNRPWLIKRLAWRLQALTDTGSKGGSGHPRRMSWPSGGRPSGQPSLTLSWTCRSAMRLNNQRRSAQYYGRSSRPTVVPHWGSIRTGGVLPLTGGHRLTVTTPTHRVRGDAGNRSCRHRCPLRSEVAADRE